MYWASDIRNICISSAHPLANAMIRLLIYWRKHVEAVHRFEILRIAKLFSKHFPWKNKISLVFKSFCWFVEMMPMIELHLHDEFIASNPKKRLQALYKFPHFYGGHKITNLHVVSCFSWSALFFRVRSWFKKIWNHFWSEDNTERCSMILTNEDRQSWDCYWRSLTRYYINNWQSVVKIFTRIRSRCCKQLSPILRAFPRNPKRSRFVENLKISPWSIPIQLLSLNNILALPRLCWSSHNLVNSASRSTDKRGTNRYFSLNALSWYNFPRSIHRRREKGGGKSFISSGK